MNTSWTKNTDINIHYFLSNMFRSLYKIIFRETCLEKTYEEPKFTSVKKKKSLYPAIN